MKRFIFLRGLVQNVPGPGILMRHNDEDDIFIPVRGDHVPPARTVIVPGNMRPYEPMRENRFLLTFPPIFNIPEDIHTPFFVGMFCQYLVHLLKILKARSQNHIYLKVVF